MNYFFSQQKKGFTPSLEDGVVHRGFSPIRHNVRKLIHNMFVRRFQEVHRKTTPSFSAGFTLVETLVAVSILLLALTGPMTIAQRGLFSTISAPEDITARFLAQEALEHIRALRDGNVLSNNDWLATLDQCIGSSCIIDSPNETISVCGGACENIRKHSTSGLYGHNSSWTSTMYNRSFTIEEVDEKEVRVIVTLTWTPRQKQKTLTVVENFLNWQ